MANQYEEMKEQTDKLEVKRENKFILDQISSIEDGLNTAAPNARLPEFVFKEHFLDFFKNYRNLTAKDKSESPLYAKWIELAGSEHNEVDIINEKGETIFTTPGLFAKPTVDYKRARQIGVDDIASTASKRNRTDVEQSNFITGKVTSIINGMITVDDTIDLNRWNKILKRYDKKEEEQEVIKSTKPLSKLPKVVKEDLGLKYD